MTVLITLVTLASLSILACWGLARSRRGRVHDCCALIPHDLRDLLAGEDK